MKNAIVTGGTKGIGFAIAEMLLREGYFVYATFASDQQNAIVVSEQFGRISPNFQICQVDQTSSLAIHTFAQQLHDVQINCIVLNAGCTVRKPTSELTDGDWERMMQVHVNGNFYLIRDLWKQIAPDSRIIFIGSAMGIYPHGTSLPYGVAKAAVHAMAKNLVKDFAGTGTTVNAIAPGFVETEWQKNKPQEIRDSICNKTAIHRFAEPNEIADTVRYIINNKFVNGAIIEVTGGYCYK